MGKVQSDRKSQLRDKKRKGFSVGPANLPDGTYRRKVTKIKETLIHRAKVKKQYSKISASVGAVTDPHALRAQKLLGEAAQERLERRQAAAATAEADNSQPENESASAVHLEHRLALDRQLTSEPTEQEPDTNERRRRKTKTSSFKKEEAFAAKEKREREEAIRQAEERRNEREKKIQEREMRKKTMFAKSRNGQLKLGKQSNVLLEKIMDQMGQR